MTCSSPMTQVMRVGRFRVYRAGAHFKYPGLHLWTGKGHRQLMPLRRFWRRSDT